MSARNPFPGINPFLEGSWPDVHTALIGYIRETLAEGLPPDLVARAKEEVSVNRSTSPPAHYRADVAVNAVWPPVLPELNPHAASSETAVAEPDIIELEHPPSRWIEICDTSGQLITVIEVLSPTNKQGIGRAIYLQKQQDYLAGGINLVEVDLLRIGLPPFFDADLVHLQPATGTRYLIVATRAIRPWQREVYYCPLRQRLPAVRVPLRATDADAVLDIQPLVDRVYRTGRYWQALHGELPGPALPEADAAWVRQQLASSS